MKLICPKYNTQIRFEENISQVLIIENASVLQQMLFDIWQQANGGPGDWLLTDGLKELSLSKNAEVIFNLFALDLNNKKIVNRLYQEIEQRMTESCTEDIAEINGKIVRLLDSISTQLPYILRFDLDLNFPGLMKLYNLSLDEQEMSLTEKLCTYIRYFHQLCRTELFIFLNLKQILSTQQLSEFYKFCYYEKVYSLDIESCSVPKIETEHFTILDNDLCLISY